MSSVVAVKVDYAVCTRDFCCHGKPPLDCATCRVGFQRRCQRDKFCEAPPTRVVYKRFDLAWMGRYPAWRQHSSPLLSARPSSFATRT
ncbi:hypothetical protein KIN20_025328 [Parelaphostrongylus tenuis]|uniref:Uncharacterized protein n=1 Tax=Parelaphostrongylus tenuis TaxID=148309 RepID=A0AAD5MZD5_PARTN|nr:hypothetical protein KIN20_025328 [Parelaphostrongylus tenuis]